MKIHNHGFVNLIDVMGGNDRAIVDAARLSYGKGTQKTSDDRGLIRYLMRHRHTSPFEMVEFKFHLKMPIFVARQWIRHRTANINEMSGRYSEMPNEFFVPDQLHLQSSTNKQGRSGVAEDSSGMRKLMLADMMGTFAIYQDLISPENDVSREQARIVLPLATYTEFVWKIDLHNLFHFLKLRTDHHAQKEIRDYAEILEGIVAVHVPLAYEAWYDYSKHALTFSRQEMNALRDLLRGISPAHVEEMAGPHLRASSKREADAFHKALGITAE
jgi:thymidylate synthase (FAD)